MEQEINNFESAEFLFAKPYCENHYLYTIDDLNSLSIIDKSSLRKILIKLECKNFIKIEYLLNRNLPLFYKVKAKELKEFQFDELTEQDIHNLIYENIIENNNSKNQSTYDLLFGENSTFYKQNIYDMGGLKNNGNSEPIQSNISFRKQ